MEEPVPPTVPPVAPHDDLSPADDDLSPAGGAFAPEVDPGQKSKKRQRSSTRTAVEWILLIATALIIALVVKAFLFQAFYIPSDSMVPTLKTHDRVIVNKLSYRFHSVHRGDIVVFTTPKDPTTGKPIDPTIKDLVKRVIGLPGDTVSAKDGHVYIDGKELKESYLQPSVATDCIAFSVNCFPSGPIPAGHYWVMGDNRTESRDSRYFGTITKSEIVGRVFVRIWPLNRLGLL